MSKKYSWVVDLLAVISFLFVTGIICGIELYVKNYRDNMVENLASTEAYIFTGCKRESAYAISSIRSYECAWCHRTNSFVRAKAFFDTEPTKLEVNNTNSFILCRDCTFVLADRCSKKKFNPDLREIVFSYTNSFDK